MFADQNDLLLEFLVANEHAQIGKDLTLFNVCRVRDYRSGIPPLPSEKDLSENVKRFSVWLRSFLGLRFCEKKNLMFI